MYLFGITETRYAQEEIWDDIVGEEAYTGIYLKPAGQATKRSAPTSSGDFTLTDEIAKMTRPLSHWLGLLDDPDWRVRNEAAFELVKKSRKSRAVIPPLKRS